MRHFINQEIYTGTFVSNNFKRLYVVRDSAAVVFKQINNNTPVARFKIRMIQEQTINPKH